QPVGKRAARRRPSRDGLHLVCAGRGGAGYGNPLLNQARRSSGLPLIRHILRTCFWKCGTKALGVPLSSTTWLHSGQRAATPFWLISSFGSTGGRCVTTTPPWTAPWPAATPIGLPQCRQTTALPAVCSWPIGLAQWGQKLNMHAPRLIS